MVWKADDRLMAMIASHFSIGNVLHRRDMLDAGIVDQDVDRAECLCRLYHQRPALGRLRHVSLDVGGLHLVIFGNRIGNGVVIGHVGERVDDDVAAFGRQRTSNGQTDA